MTAAPGAPGTFPADAGEDLVGAALHRAGVLRLLAAALTYPTTARLGHLARLARELAAAPAVDGSLREPLARLARAAGEHDAGALAAEHLRLFEGQVRCPPYEGAYGARQMSGKAAQLADIAGFYAAFGLEPAPGRPEVEDHIAAELEFMSALALKEAWARAGNEVDGLDVVRRAQEAFLVEHLGRWGGVFAAGLEASGGYHAAVGALLAACLRVETTVLGVSPSRLGDATASEEGPFTCPMAPGDAEA
jgi:TorA maturation chaperone TorD